MSFCQFNSNRYWINNKTYKKLLFINEFCSTTQNVLIKIMFSLRNEKKQFWLNFLQIIPSLRIAKFDRQADEIIRNWGFHRKVTDAKGRCASEKISNSIMYEWKRWLHVSAANFPQNHLKITIFMVHRKRGCDDDASSSLIDDIMLHSICMFKHLHTEKFALIRLHDEN